MAESQLAQQQLDQHAGRGGSYVIDPETGNRTLVERTKQVGESKEADTGLVSQDSVNAEQVDGSQAVPADTEKLATADEAVTTKKQPKEKA